jgi:hypothetical protein
MEPKPPMAKPKPSLDPKYLKPREKPDGDGASLLEDLIDAADSLNEDQNASAKMGWRWNCPAPARQTACVRSSNTAWRTHDRGRFEAACDGTLVGFTEAEQNLQDCGVVCWGCSMLRACCIPHPTAIRTEYVRMQTVHAATTETLTEGIETTNSGSNSIEVAIAAEMSAEYGGVSASVSSSITTTVERSWSHTQSSTYERTVTQPAYSTLWNLRTSTTMNGRTVHAYTRDYILTRRSTAPRCIPGECVDTFDNGGNCQQCHPGGELSG